MSNTLGGYSLPHEHPFKVKVLVDGQEIKPKARLKKGRARWDEKPEPIQLPDLDPSGRWVMLTVKLPTRPSPPMLSIFWSVPWPDMGRVRDQISHYGSDYEPDEPLIHDIRGKEPNWRLARKIVYQGNDIRVFAHELSFVTLANFRAYVFGFPGETPSHEFVPGDTAAGQLLQNTLEGDDKFIVDAAMVDGCTPAQALAVALGSDITDEEMEFPALGWYRCRPEYALMFCDPDEITETPANPINLDNQDQGEDDDRSAN